MDRIRHYGMTLFLVGGMWMLFEMVLHHVLDDK